MVFEKETRTIDKANKNNYCSNKCFRKQISKVPDAISKEEIELIKSLSNTGTIKDIAIKIGRSTKTVRKYLNN